jgi:signal transduction histidine kinase
VSGGFEPVAQWPIPPRGHAISQRVGARLAVFGLLLLVVEGGLGALGSLRAWVWALAVAQVGFAAAGFFLAGQRQRTLDIPSYVIAGGCVSLALGFVTRMLQESQGLGPREEVGFPGAVPFFVLAALAMLRGELVWLRRGKLLLDALIVVVAPWVAGLMFSDRVQLPPLEERGWATAVFFAASYSAAAYAVLAATRRVALERKGSTAAALALAMVCLAGAACAPVARQLSPGVGSLMPVQTLWSVGAALLALAGWRASRSALLQQGSEEMAPSGEDSRLRMLPAALAAVVVVASPIQQAASPGGPSGPLFYATFSLFWLIVARLLLTLAENRRLLRTVQSVDRGQLALRDLGAVLDSSLEEQTVWRNVCVQGQNLLRADSAVLWLVDRAANQIVAVEAVGGKREEFLRRTLSLDDRSSLAVRVVRNRASEIVRQAMEADRSAQLLTVLRGARCLAAVPLLREQRAVGALVFAHARDPLGFDHHDLARAEVLGNQATIVLRNATLYREVQQSLENARALYGFAQACDGAFDSQGVIRELLWTLYDKVHFDQASVLLADDGLLVSARGLTMRRLPGQQEPSLDVAPSRISPLASRSFRTRALAVARDGDGEFRPLLPDSAVQIVVPIFLRDAALGVVELESAEVDLLREPTQELVAGLARHAALTLNRLQLEEHTREVENLKKLDRLKTELLGNLSHELRTPLHAIKGYATTLLEHQRMKPDLRREFLQVIDSESDRLEELISNLLEMSRIEAGVLKVDPVPTQLASVAESAVKRLEHLSAEHTFRLQWDEDLWVNADIPRILQILMNLLSNAVKYSPEGGEILVRGRAEEDVLVVSVSDHGVGIPPREAAKIFDRFHRVEDDLARRVSGTGLGLAICKCLVVAHGGRIWVESVPGVGSTFSFTLPICDPGEQ